MASFLITDGIERMLDDSVQTHSECGLSAELLLKRI